MFDYDIYEDAFMEGYEDAMLEMEDEDDYDEAYMEGYMDAINEGVGLKRGAAGIGLSTVAGATSAVSGGVTVSYAARIAILKKKLKKAKSLAEKKEIMDKIEKLRKKRDKAALVAAGAGAAKLAGNTLVAAGGRKMYKKAKDQLGDVKQALVNGYNAASNEL